MQQIVRNELEIKNNSAGIFKIEENIAKFQLPAHTTIKKEVITRETEKGEYQESVYSVYYNT